MASLLELPGRLADGPLGRPQAAAWVRRAVWVLLALAGAGLFAVGGAQPADPSLVSSRVPGFGEATLRVRPASDAASGRLGVGGMAERCALLAETPAQHARGLMTRTDLAGYAAMAFRFDRDVAVQFYNRNVPIALSVAWFDSAGRWLGSGDLEPCPDIDRCPTIAAPAPFRYVIEVPKGGLAGLGLGAGAQISVTSGC